MSNKGRVYQLICAPFELGSRTAGPALAPDALRSNGLKALVLIGRRCWVVLSCSPVETRGVVSTRQGTKADAFLATKGIALPRAAPSPSWSRKRM